MKTVNRKAKRKLNLTIDEKASRKRIYDREFQRKRRKVSLEINSKKSCFDEVYRNGIVNSFSKDSYSHLITLTLDPHYTGKRINRGRKGFANFQEHFSEMPKQKTLKFFKNSISIEFVALAQNSYLKFLYNNFFIRGFFSVIEQGTEGRYHIHTLIEKNPLLVAIKDFQNFWLYGNVDILPVYQAEYSKRATLQYMTDRLKPTAFSHKKQKLIDSWVYYKYQHNYRKPILKGGFKNELHRYKALNNLLYICLPNKLTSKVHSPAFV